MTPKRVIGLNGALPWHLPADLAFFKRTTSGHPIVMGRKTFESIGRPLPNRRNIVLSRDPHWTAPGTCVIHHIDQLAEITQNEPLVFVIGGAEIYRALLPQTDKLLISRLKKNYPGDTYLPNFEHDFELTEIIEEHPEFVVESWKRTRAFTACNPQQP